MKRILCALLAVLMVLPMVGCGGAAPAEETKANTVVDLLGREINVPEQVDRIAAIAGPTYEMVFMLGGADKIVMVKSGHTDSYPLANLTNPNLKDMVGLSANPSSTVNIEDYLEQDIDLVVYYDNEIELKKFDAVDMAAVVASKNTGLMASLEEARTLDVTISAKKTIQFMPPADFFTPEERKEIIPYLEQKIENCTDTQQKREWIACRSVLVREHYGTGKGYDAWLSMLSLGDVVFCNTPFEYASVDADVLKARLNEEYGKDFVVCCYSNGYEGYLPSGRKLDRDSGYEDMASNLRSDAKYLVADAFSAMPGTL